MKKREKSLKTFPSKPLPRREKKGNMYKYLHIL